MIAAQQFRRIINAAMAPRGPQPPPPENNPTNEVALTLDAFWTRWGERSGFTREQLDMAWADAENQYGELPYHNFEHALETLWGTMELTDLCEQNGVEVNRKTLIGAALFHDAGYDRDAPDYGSKEAYSAALFELFAPSYGYAAEEIAIGKQAILATKVSAKPESIEDKILVRADLKNLGEDYTSSVLRKTNLLKEESKILKGNDFNPMQFAADSICVVATYLGNDLSLGEFEENWTKRAALNIKRLIFEFAAEQSTSAAKYIQGLGSVAVVRLLNKLSKSGDSDQAEVS
jgi:hypothetical protein